MFQSSIFNSLTKVISLQVQRFRDPARPISQNLAHNVRADYNWQLIWISQDQARLARFMDKAMKAKKFFRVDLRWEKIHQGRDKESWHGFTSLLLHRLKLPEVLGSSQILFFKHK